MGYKWMRLERILSPRLVMALILIFGVAVLAFTIQPRNTSANNDIRGRISDPPMDLAAVGWDSSNGTVTLITGSSFEDSGVAASKYSQRSDGTWLNDSPR